MQELPAPFCCRAFRMPLTRLSKMQVHTFAQVTAVGPGVCLRTMKLVAQDENFLTRRSSVLIRSPQQSLQIGEGLSYRRVQEVQLLRPSARVRTRHQLQPAFHAGWSRNRYINLWCNCVHDLNIWRGRCQAAQHLIFG